MITVHGRATSSNVQKVRWALGELGRNHRIVERGGAHGGLDDPDFQSLTPFGLVPVYEDDEIVAQESNAILRHLGRTARDEALWPVSDQQALVRADAIIEWSTHTLWGAVRPPYIAVAREGMSRSDEALGRQVATLAGPLTVLENLLNDTDWLTGDAFGLADIPAAVAMSRLVWLVGRGVLPPATGRWYDACAERPAWRAVVYVEN
ncbi:MAG: glutathione S-transferase family protein [Paracoccaceae bacterium]